MAEDKQEKKNEPKEQKKDEVPAGAPAEKGRKKLSKMTLNEVEDALKTAKNSMGGGKSKYIEHLEQRKKELGK
ncbi:MAG: hypothetical protein PHO00_00420 [bacterium]|nr:hypothetical protein [bacterium]